MVVAETSGVTWVAVAAFAISLVQMVVALGALLLTSRNATKASKFALEGRMPAYVVQAWSPASHGRHDGIFVRVGNLGPAPLVLRGSGSAVGADVKERVLDVGAPITLGPFPVVGGAPAPGAFVLCDTTMLARHEFDLSRLTLEDLSTDGEDPSIVYPVRREYGP